MGRQKHRTREPFALSKQAALCHLQAAAPTAVLGDEKGLNEDLFASESFD